LDHLLQLYHTLSFLICGHRERAAIDLALSPWRECPRRCRGHDNVLRHAKNHLPPQLRAKLIAKPDLDVDLDRLRETESQSLLLHLVNVRGRLFHSLDVAEEVSDGAMISKLAG
jgi:hypothetical protein